MTPARVVVVGASAAGLAAAETLRHEGFSGELTMIGAEHRRPYDRPPLSKQVLTGSWDPDRVELRNAAGIDALQARWLLGREAVGLDIGNRSVALDDGTEVPFDGLVIATGVRPRRLVAGHDLRGVHLLRDLDDAITLRHGLREARAVAVVGAGFLGSEVAAVARGLAREVTLIDPLPAPMVRQLGSAVAARIAGLHERHGVDVRCGGGVAHLTSSDGAVTGVRLVDGTVITADLVLVAIGSTPAVEWLRGSGLTLDDGVVCDEYCSAAAGIVAAGDIASWAHPTYGRLRLEHRLNATEQGRAAALTLLGERTPFAPVPYFWTDQYDVKIQAYGRTAAAFDFMVVSGDIHGDKFAALYGHAGRVIGALTWNLPRQARELRALVQHSAPWPTSAPIPARPTHPTEPDSVSPQPQRGSELTVPAG